MNRKLLSAVCVAALTIGGAAQAQDSAMTFFLATNPGKGGDLGGLTGADARCQSLAKEANAGGKTWRGDLSANGGGGAAGGEAGAPRGRGREGSAFVGHHDREGLRDDASSKSWNSSHPSRGCSLEALNGTGGNGYFYCFAAN